MDVTFLQALGLAPKGFTVERITPALTKEERSMSDNAALAFWGQGKPQLKICVKNCLYPSCYFS
jgi:hypothetical protein